jgi:hypothetical protein
MPQQFAHPGAFRGVVTRHVETPRVLEAPRQEKHQIGGPDLGPANLDARQRRELTNRIGRNVTPQNQPNQKWQLTGGNRAASDRVLRNSFFANKPAAGDPAARRLARSTFHGRFFDRDGRHHHRRAIVIDWAGRRTLFAQFAGMGSSLPIRPAFPKVSFLSVVVERIDPRPTR